MDPSQKIIDKDYEDNSDEVIKLGSTLTLLRGIVIETLCDPSLRLDEAPESLVNDLNKYLYKVAPRNSIICRLTTDGSSGSSTEDLVCFPFWSSHFSLPVKTGEQVWIIKENPGLDKKSVRHYWLSRVPGEIEYEDPNFTSFTRNIQKVLTSSVEPSDKRIVGFPNIDSEEKTALLDGEDDAIEAVIKKSVEIDQVVFEPIPRLTKRPGDLVLQGSNNTSMTFGSNNRGFTLDERPKENTTSSTATKPDEKSGTIDIVAGRGRYFEVADDEIKKSRKKKEVVENENSTKPFVVKTPLGFETDKDPQETQERDSESDASVEGYAPADLGNLKSNPSEGDPDFVVDASRVYVSEKTDIDNKLGLDKIVAKGFAADYSPVEASPCIAVKSDNIRIVARHLPNTPYDPEILPPKFENVKGTIRIVKEGDPDTDLAAIYIEADGTIQISGSKIFLGRQKADGGAGNGPGDGEAQPYVKYQELEDLWKDTMKELDKFCQTLMTHVTPGFGAPSPQVTQAATDLKSAIASKLKGDIANVKSERIFGE
jgi:hypothetical protein